MKDGLGMLAQELTPACIACQGVQLGIKVTAKDDGGKVLTPGSRDDYALW